MRILATLWALLVYALSAPSLSLAQAGAQPAIAIIHVTVINPGTSSVERNRTVIIAGDHIGSVSDAAPTAVPKNVRVIDGTGLYLIPGLWDMHVHSAFGDWFP